MALGVGHGLGVGLGMREIGVHVLGLIALLPSDDRAQKRERLPGSGGRFEQRVAVAVPLSSIESGDDPAHERHLGRVRLVRELHFDASDAVHVFGAFRVRCRSCRRHFFSAAGT